MTDPTQEIEEEMIEKVQALTMDRDPSVALTARISLELAPTLIRIVRNEAMRDTPRINTLAAILAVQTDLLYTLIRGIIPGKENQKEILREVGKMIQRRIDNKHATTDEELKEKRNA